VANDLKDILKVASGKVLPSSDRIGESAGRSFALMGSNGRPCGHAQARGRESINPIDAQIPMLADETGRMLDDATQNEDSGAPIGKRLSYL
jgi:hypothetical protein